MKYFIKILILILVTNVTWGQLVVSPSLTNNVSIDCDNELTESGVEYLNKTRALRNEIDLEVFRSASPTQPVVVPIFAHVLIQNAGVILGPDMTVNEVDQAIARMNTLYDGSLIQFQRCAPVNYIAETGHPLGLNFYPSLRRDDLVGGNHEASIEFRLARNEITDEGAINIFFVRDLESPTGNDICGTSSFPWFRQDFNKDWILTDNDCAEPSSLTHEMGHYFNLFHTHEGFLGFENADGSNCGDGVGDELCDTPADPTFRCIQNCGFAGEVDYHIRNCNMAVDCMLNPVGALCAINFGDGIFTPATDNIMSYNHHICRTNFTDDQIERMQRSLLFDRRYLNNDCDCLPDQQVNNRTFTDDFILEDVEASNSISTSNQVQVTPFANVKFDAGNFVCLNPGFLAEYGSIFLGIIDGCAGEFRTAESGVIKNSMNTFDILPNPFSKQCNIVYNLNEDNLITITVSDIVGKKITTLLNNEQKHAGQHKIAFDASNLQAGIYYCTIQAGDYFVTQKMVLTK